MAAPRGPAGEPVGSAGGGGEGGHPSAIDVKPVEVVSPDEDLVHKRRDYAEAAVPEYWIVDPGTEAITVLKFG